MDKDEQIKHLVRTVKTLEARLSGGFKLDRGGIILVLNDYQASNLKAAIQACENYESPLRSLCTGDWIGEIRNMLDDFEGHGPNLSAMQMAQNAGAKLGVK